MTVDTVFSLSNSIALIAWVYLIAVARWTPRVFAALRVALPLALSTTYVVCLSIALPSSDGGFGSIEAVRTLFSNDWALTGGWVHYLAFDFLVGCWMMADAKERDTPHWLLVPCLVATFMLGPFGYLAFQLVKSFRGNWSITLS